MANERSGRLEDAQGDKDVKVPGDHRRGQRPSARAAIRRDDRRGRGLTLAHKKKKKKNKKLTIHK